MWLDSVLSAESFAAGVLISRPNILRRLFWLKSMVLNRSVAISRGVAEDMVGGRYFGGGMDEKKGGESR